jgi:uncharacterized protein (TIGR02466 family)
MREKFLSQNINYNPILIKSINQCKQGKYNIANKTLSFNNNYNDWRILFLLSAIASQKKNNKNIIELSKLTQKKLPYSRFSNNNLGNIYLKLGMVSKAMTYFKLSITSKTDEINIYKNFNIFLKKIRKYRNLNNPNINKITYLKKLKKDLEELEAKILLRQIVTLGRPHFAELYNKIEILLNHLNEINLEIKTFRKLNISKIISKIIKLKKRFETLKKINADYDNSYFNLAICYKLKKNYIKSNKYFILANKLDKTNKFNYRILINLYLLNDKKNFLKLLNKVNRNKKIDFYSLAVANFVSEQWKIKNNYSFCNNPLLSIYKTNVLGKKNFSQKSLNFIEKDIKTNRNKLHTPVVIGHKSIGNLFESKQKNINKLKKIIIENINYYKKFFSFDKNIMIKKFPKKYELNGWYISLKRGGEVTSHIHDGWLSGVFYVKIPKQKKQFYGDIELTTRYDHLPLNNNFQNIKTLKINSGDLLLFPSSLPHRVLPFDSNKERLSIAFDMKPIT